jgi:hypothetical protein
MGQLVQNIGLRSTGGGNATLVGKLTKNSSGVFSLLATGTDDLGAAAGVFHPLGSIRKTKNARTSDGKWGQEYEVLELDLDHKNLLIKVAPYSATATDQEKEGKTEDGAKFGGGSGDDTLPYWLVIQRGKDVGGKAHVFYFVAQFSREGGWDQDPENVSVQTLKLNTVDANGFVAVNPAAPPSWLTGVTAPTLSGIYAMGKWVEAV